MIYVSHSISEVLAIADHVLILDEGRFVNSVSSKDLFLDTDLISSDYWFGFENIKSAKVVSQINSDQIVEIEIGGVVFNVSGEQILLNDQVNVAVGSNEIILSKIQTFDTSVQNIIRGEIVSINEFESFALVCVKAGENFLSRISLAAARNLELNVGEELFMMIKSNSIKVLNG